MALPAQEIHKVARAINHTLSPTPWTRPELENELTTLDAFKDTNDVTVNTTFTAGFRGKSTVPQRALMSIALDIRRRLAGNPEEIDALISLLEKVK